MQDLFPLFLPQRDYALSVLVRHRYLALLIALIILLISGPFIHMLWGGERSRTASLLNTLAFSLTLLAGVFVDEVKKKGWYVALLFAMGTVIFQIAHSISDLRVVNLAALFCAAGFVALTVIRALRDVFQAKRVSTETIAAALCVYLLLGVGWSIAYSFVGSTIPGAFSISGLGTDGANQMEFGTENASLSLYYSFVTLTTLGYGDVSPAAPLSRMLAALEALTGQLYIAVLVARLVALQILHSEKHE